MRPSRSCERRAGPPRLGHARDVGVGGVETVAAVRASPMSDEASKPAGGRTPDQLLEQLDQHVPDEPKRPDPDATNEILASSRSPTIAMLPNTSSTASTTRPSAPFSRSRSSSGRHSLSSKPSEIPSGGAWRTRA